MRIIRGIGVVLALGAFIGSLYAGTTGKITGRVIDKETGDPLPGANVVIVGTKIGTATDLDGYYFLINIPPGTYTLRASMIGYNPQEIKGVVVKADLTTEVNFYLTSTAIRTEEIVVTAERELIERTATETRRVVSSQDISQLPYTNFQAAVTMQAGVTGVNIVRGGRDDEIAYYVDGMLVNSPVYGGFYQTINNSAIQEMSLITGGFNAEYGQALSGVINVITKEGGTKYSGEVFIRSDEILPEKYSRGYNRASIAFGGPVPGTAKKVRFYITTEAFAREGATGFNYQPEYPIVKAYEIGTEEFRAFVDTAKAYWYDPRNSYVDSLYRDYYEDAVYWQNWYKDHPYMLPHTWRQDYYLQGKLTFLPFENVKVLISGNTAREQFGRYGYGVEQRFKYREFRNRVDLRKRSQVTATINHVIRNNLFYTLNIGYFYNFMKWGVADKEYEDTARVSFLDKLIKDVRFEGYVPDPDTARVIIPGYERYNFGPGNPWGIGDQSNVRFVSTGDYRVLHVHTEETKNLKWDLTWQVNKYHEVKTGIEIREHKIDFYHNSLPWDPNPFLDVFHTTPRQASAYVQDKMEFEGLIVNAGLRLDYVDPNYDYYLETERIRPDTFFVATPEDTIPKTVKPKWQISPRLGISHPITERQVLHFAYGHFFQTPPLLYFYSTTHKTIQQVMQRGNEIVGNPDLKAEKQIAYEVGVATQLTDNSALDVTAFYRDIYRWIGTRSVIALPQSFYIYVNGDYGNVKGLELTYQYNTKYLNFRTSYTLQFAEGTAADPFESYENSYYGTLGRDPRTGQPLPIPHSIIPLGYDRRHTVNAQLTLRTPADLGPKGILGDMLISIIQRSQSGEPYTPRDYKGNIIADINSERMPWSHNTDLRVSKSIKVKGVEFEILAEIFNLFNIKNVTGVYETTGLPDDNGMAQFIRVEQFGTDTFAIGETGYNPLRDINGDGKLTPEERYETYLMAMKDYLATPLHYGDPRTIRFGIAIRF